MRSSNDPITGLKNSLLEWGVIEESELKAIDKAARHEVEVAVEEAKKSPEPSQQTDMYTDSEFGKTLLHPTVFLILIHFTVYYKGTAPMYMRGREREEVSLKKLSPSFLRYSRFPFNYRSTTSRLRSLTYTLEDLSNSEPLKRTVTFGTLTLL